MTARSEAAAEVKEENRDLDVSLLHQLAGQLHGGGPPTLQLFSLQVSLRETKVRVGSGPQKPHKAQKELGGGGKLSKECPQMCSLFPHPYV